MAIRAFWQRLKRLIRYAKQNGVSLPEDILFTQVLYALALTSVEKHLALSHFETIGDEGNIKNLFSIAIKLFGTYQSPPAQVYQAVGEMHTDSDESMGHAEGGMWVGGKEKRKLEAGMKPRQRSDRQTFYPSQIKVTMWGKTRQCLNSLKIAHHHIMGRAIRYRRNA